LDHARDDSVVQGHPLMQVPAFDGVGIDDGEIDLPELLEMGVVPPQHVHDLSPLVRDLPQLMDEHAFYHATHVAKKWRYQVIVSCRPFCSVYAARQSSRSRAFAADRYCCRISPRASSNTAGVRCPQ